MNTRSPFFRLAVVILALTVPTFAFAGSIGKPAGGGDSIRFDISATGHDSIVLVVAHGDEVYTKAFKAGKPVVFNLRDMPSDVDVEGAYVYELRYSPAVSPGLEKKLASARAAGDEKAAKKALKDAGIVVPETQSGSFLVIGGAIVDPNGSAESNAKANTNLSTNAVGTPGLRGPAGRFTPETLDQVIPDDLIVQGSTCVGFDCVDGESFGVDTIRLKENNTRINFDDTSTSAGYAANDWRIIANDQPSGGANYLAIEDSTAARQLVRVTAGAPANSLFVSANGDIGSKTSTPGLDFQATVSDTPGLRLEQTNAGGFTAQTWDVAGNEANFFVRDVTGGSRLSFRIRPGAPTSSIDISADGDVGVGTAGPNANTRMDLSDTTQLKARLALTGQEFFQAANTSTDGLGLVLGVNRAGNRQLWITDTSEMAVNTTNGVVRLRPNNGSIDSMSTSATAKPLLLQTLGGNIGVGGEFTPAHPIHHTSGAHLSSGGAWTNASSRALKEDINELSAGEAMDALQALKPVTFVYKANRNDPVVGFIAEDVPEIVAQPDHKTLGAMDIVGVLTKVVQEQQKTIDELSKKIEGLEKQNQ